jgi:hypothetical protein
MAAPGQVLAWVLAPAHRTVEPAASMVAANRLVGPLPGPAQVRVPTVVPEAHQAQEERAALAVLWVKPARMGHAQRRPAAAIRPG